MPNTTMYETEMVIFAMTVKKIKSSEHVSLCKVSGLDVLC